MKNWGGNIDYGDAVVHAPETIDQLQETVASSTKCRALGSRHSFNRSAASAAIIDTSKLPRFVRVADDARTARVSGFATYARVAKELGLHGLALGNMASLPHISVAGAIATGTHGSGDRNQNLAGAVAAITVLQADGATRELKRGEDDFAGAVVNLGALGIVTEVELDVVPSYDVEQRVFDGPSLDVLAENVDAVFGAGYSVSVFTSWAGVANQIWVKHRVGDSTPEASAAFLGPLAPAKERRHPVIELDASGCTEQGGVAGVWAERLPHFQMGFEPSAGDEIQSEFFVDRRFAAQSIEAMSSVGADIADAIMVGEIRTVAGDELWMSPHVGRDSLGFHFTWHPGQAVAEQAANAVADALAPFDVRAHWGKVFDPARIDLNQYEQRAAFLDLVDRMDPAGKFRNDWFDEVVVSPS